MKLTNEQKTRLLAEGVMGWEFAKGDKNHFDAWKTASGYIRVDIWQPLTNESHAAEVRERMRELGWDINQTAHPGGINIAAVLKTPDGPCHLIAIGTPTEALCNAALLALALAKEDEL